MNKDSYTFTYDTIPNEHNIDYMFQRLLLPVDISLGYKPYEKHWSDFEKIYQLVKGWINVYYETKDLTKIDTKDYKEFDSLITDVKFTCLDIDPTYVEEIDIWHNEFLILSRKAYLEKRDKTEI